LLSHAHDTHILAVHPAQSMKSRGDRQAPHVHCARRELIIVLGQRSALWHAAQRNAPQIVQSMQSSLYMGMPQSHMKRCSDGMYVLDMLCCSLIVSSIWRYISLCKTPI
jgi:hypothetical protein